MFALSDAVTRTYGPDRVTVLSVEATYADGSYDVWDADTDTITRVHGDGLALHEHTVATYAPDPLSTDHVGTCGTCGAEVVL